MKINNILYLLCITTSFNLSSNYYNNKIKFNQLNNKKTYSSDRTQSNKSTQVNINILNNQDNTELKKTQDIIDLNSSIKKFENIEKINEIQIDVLLDLINDMSDIENKVSYKYNQYKKKQQEVYDLLYNNKLIKEHIYSLYLFMDEKDKANEIINKIDEKKIEILKHNIHGFNTSENSFKRFQYISIKIKNLFEKHTDIEQIKIKNDKYELLEITSTLEYIVQEIYNIYSEQQKSEQYYKQAYEVFQEIYKEYNKVYKQFETLYEENKVQKTIHEKFNRISQKINNIYQNSKKKYEQHIELNEKAINIYNNYIEKNQESEEIDQKHTKINKEINNIEEKFIIEDYIIYQLYTNANKDRNNITSSLYKNTVKNKEKEKVIKKLNQILQEVEEKKQLVKEIDQEYTNASEEINNIVKRLIYAIIEHDIIDQEYIKVNEKSNQILQEMEDKKQAFKKTYEKYIKKIKIKIIYSKRSKTKNKQLKKYIKNI